MSLSSFCLSLLYLTFSSVFTLFLMSCCSVVKFSVCMRCVICRCVCSSFLLRVSFLMCKLLISFLMRSVCAVVVVFRDAYVLCLSCSFAYVGVTLCVVHCLLNHKLAIV